MHTGRFSEQALSNTAWAYAKLGHAAPALLDAIADEAIGRGLGRCDQQTLCNIAWAYATVSSQHGRPTGHSTVALSDAIAAAALPRLHDFTAQGLANMAWAYARLGHSAPPLTPAVLEADGIEATGRARLVAAREARLDAHYSSRNGVTALLDGLAREVVARGLRHFGQQHLANLVWAYATLGHAAPSLFDAVAEEAAARLHEAEGGATATAVPAATATAVPAATTASSSTGFPAATASTAAAAASSSTAPATASTAAAAASTDAATVESTATTDAANGGTPTALAGMQAALGRFFGGRAAATAVGVTGESAAVKAGAAVAGAKAAPKAKGGRPANGAPAKGRRTASPRYRPMQPQELANLAWAFAAANHPAPVLFDGDAFVALCERTLPPAPVPVLTQFHQWQLWVTERGERWPQLPPELARRCHAAFCADEGRPSQLQRDVVEALRFLQLGAPVQLKQEVRTPLGYSVDAVLLYGGREVAVEVDGPSHFFGQIPTGATALKRRQLRAAGWALLPVPYWEWNALADANAKEAYLLAALLRLPPPAPR